MQGPEAWTLQSDEALQRTRNDVSEVYHDEWTAVAKHAAAGHGLFCTTLLPAGTALFAYTGTARTAEQADRRPAAFYFSYNDDSVCDAGSLYTSSQARWISTQPYYKRHLCNCEYKNHNGKLYLVTLRTIPPMQELFAGYGRGPGRLPFAEWPVGFLGDAYQQVSDYREYLQNTPANATSRQKKRARKLTRFLEEDIKSEACVAAAP